ncbi:hypothetical protein P43SY_009818 [Pythium insidiosum]|uniref:Transmembrane protein n=1 Tax=Pythium insidiosum TaxID=114742 RepID=A0AAD5LZF1_PYTIN|nr:hypothetical protein P43SY_009818 [Pythium insidiosum]
MDNPKPTDSAHGSMLRRRAIQTYPGVGTASDIHAPPEELETLRDKLHTKRHLLGEWPSTAICGNGILSSVLYSSGLVAEKAGKLAPIPLIMVSDVLYFFRFIYEEVVTAIPLNGGSYNVLLNTTSKRVAAFGAALGILSYLATGVVSATSAINYINREIGFESSAQFFEEQQPGVCRKTLRNMWGFATVADVVRRLCMRLASDRMLPSFRLKTNKWRGTHHGIILLYFIIASSLVLILDADTSAIGGVYTRRSCSKHPDMTIINKAILYVRKNEHTHNLRIVHVEHTGESMGAGEAQAVRDEFENITALFNHVYPKLKIDFVSMRGEFEPALPSDKEVHKVAALGVRVITARRVSKQLVSQGSHYGLMFQASEAKMYQAIGSPYHAAGTVRRRAIQVEVPEETAAAGPAWVFPGFGSAKEVTAPQEELSEIREKLSGKPDELNQVREGLSAKRTLLGEWPSTAISGNDLLASVLYSAGVVTEKAGKLAPIAFMLVATVLYLFRFIYEEVVTAIPLNGGSYNVLLNATSKRVAVFGAAMSILSYLATGVVSGTSAISYLHREVDIPVVVSTVALLFLFALLNIVGIAESSRVALVIFVHHALVLTIMVVVGFIYLFQHPDVFAENMRSPLPRVDFAGGMIDSNAFTAIVFGFGAAMLGVTGFETSAQFVEEQKPGVFRKTLRNMWFFAAIYNTLLSILSFGVLPIERIYANRDTVLAETALVAAGRWLSLWVSIDSFIVLSGGALTAYVGITGLCRRLASDRVLPAFLLKTNKWRGSNHSIILVFFALMASFVIVLKADTVIMGGVFTYAFLGMMALFSIGCMLLKAKRSKIPRDISAPWWMCIVGFIFIIIGIFANLLGDPKVLMYFALYYIVGLTVMFMMLDRISILRLVLSVLQRTTPSRHADSESLNSPALTTPLSPEYTAVDEKTVAQHTGARGGRTIARAIMAINDRPMVFFCKHPDLTLLNKAILYVRNNEQTSNLYIIHVANEVVDGGESGGASDVRSEFENIVTLFNHVYPKIKIDFVSVQGEFEPALVKWLSESLHIPTNLMFIAQPTDKVVHRVASMGVRVITH